VFCCLGAASESRAPAGSSDDADPADSCEAIAGAITGAAGGGVTDADAAWISDDANSARTATRWITGASGAGPGMAGRTSETADTLALATGRLGGSTLEVASMTPAAGSPLASARWIPVSVR
jgi:hypothetical protein